MSPVLAAPLLKVNGAEIPAIGLGTSRLLGAVAAALPDPSVPDAIRRQALLHFWRGIAVEAIAKRRFAWGLAWARSIRTLSPLGATRILLTGVLKAVVTLTGLVLSKTVQRFSGKSSLMVLHER